MKHSSVNTGPVTMCSIPLPRDDGLLGVLTLERASDHPFAPAELALCEAVVAMAGPILEARSVGRTAGSSPKWRRRCTRSLDACADRAM